MRTLVVEAVVIALVAGALSFSLPIFLFGLFHLRGEPDAFVAAVICVLVAVGLMVLVEHELNEAVRRYVAEYRRRHD